MRLVAPEGPVYQAGTLSGNPVAMAAGLATLRETERPGFYDLLERRTARLVAGIGDAARRHGVAATGGYAGSMWGVYLTAGPVRTFAQAKGADTGLFARWHRAALARGERGRCGRSPRRRVRTRACSRAGTARRSPGVCSSRPRPSRQASAGNAMPGAPRSTFPSVASRWRPAGATAAA